MPHNHYRSVQHVAGRMEDNGTGSAEVNHYFIENLPRMVEIVIKTNGGLTIY